MNLPKFFSDFASDDKSLVYLNQIFGDMNGIIPWPQNETILQKKVGLVLFGSIFSTFNAVVLSIGALIVIYTTVVGLMQTAHEGEFLGKKWHGLWTPLRTVLGIALLAPLSVGYSGIQLIMMWVIVQGIGAADHLWNITLSSVSLLGSPYASVTVTNMASTMTIPQLFQGLVCDETARFQGTDPTQVPNGGYYCASSGADQRFCGSPPDLNAGGGTYILGPGGSCGILTYCDSTSSCASDPNSLLCKSCQTQVQVLNTIISSLRPIAQNVVQADYTYRDFYANSWKETNVPQMIGNYCNQRNLPTDQCCVATNNPFLKPAEKCNAPVSNTNPVFPSPNYNKFPQSADPQAATSIYLPYLIQQIGDANFISTNVNLYQANMQKTVTDYVQNQQNTGDMSNSMKDAQKFGWIFAGSFYYVLAQVNQSNSLSANVPLSMSPVAPSRTIMNNFRNNVIAAQAILSVVNGGSSNANNNGGSGGQSYGGDSSNAAPMPGGSDAANLEQSTRDSVNSAVSGLGAQSKANPLVQLQEAGYTILMIVMVIFPIILAITLALGFAGNIDVFFLGTGIIDPVGPVASLMYWIIVPAVYGLLAIMIGVGGTLGVYVPLIPYTVFAFGAIGWIMATMETMVAAPLVALGVLSPAGEHELLGKAAPAIMLLFNVFLRPSLMIIGLIAAMMAASVVVGFINAGFWPAATFIANFHSTSATASASGAASGALPYSSGGAAALAFNPLELVIFICAYVAIIVSALNKCFSLIHVIPERVLTWISGQAVSYGEAEAAGEMRKGAEAGAGGLRTAGEGAKGGGEMAVTKERGGVQNKQARAKEANAGIKRKT